jgi:hypothetical protein
MERTAVVGHHAVNAVTTGIAGSLVFGIAVSDWAILIGIAAGLMSMAISAKKLYKGTE